MKQTLVVSLAALLVASPAFAVTTINITQGSGTPFLTFQDGSSNNFSAVGLCGLLCTNEVQIDSSNRLFTTLTSGSVASGALASGSIASGAVASGAFASGSIGSGAVASGAIASGAVASGAIASGAAVSGAFADGSLVTLGAKADAKSTATDTTAITAMQVLKEISAMEQNPASRAVTNAGTFAVQSQVNTGNSNTTAHICGSHVFKHITTATDTQLVAASGSTTIYVCDYSFSFNGTGNLYLEKATSGTCATLTQLAGAWYGAANVAKTDANPYYRGLNTGASAQLCVNTSANITVDIDVYYDQY